MPMMLEKLYDALRSGNVPDDKARAAAVEVSEITSIQRLHTWILTFNTAMLAALLGKAFWT